MAEIIKDEKNQNIDAEAIDLEQLDNVNGGATEYDPGWCYAYRYMFTDSDVEILKRNNFSVQPNTWYTSKELRTIFKGYISGTSGNAMRDFLKSLGIDVERESATTWNQC
ncbi:MAG: hypothetical protein IKW87_12140 [Ruminococcus sp.]|nr:hypothetical protein [Ruminococcus sp.]